MELANVLMNLKEDYPSPDGSCNDHHELSYYDPTTTGDYQQHQLLQWPSCPSDEQQQHVVYDSLDSDQARQTHENYLIPAILGKCLLRRTTAIVYIILCYINSLWASRWVVCGGGGGFEHQARPCKECRSRLNSLLLLYDIYLFQFGSVYLFSRTWCKNRTYIHLKFEPSPTMPCGWAGKNHETSGWVLVIIQHLLRIWARYMLNSAPLWIIIRIICRSNHVLSSILSYRSINSYIINLTYQYTNNVKNMCYENIFVNKIQ